MEIKAVVVEGEIEGIAPLKMDRWLELPAPKNEEGYKKQAEEKVYKNAKGELVIPANAIKACMREASSEVGKKMEGRRNRQTIKSAVFVENDLILERNGKVLRTYDTLVKDIVVRKLSKQETRVATYRPLIETPWTAKFKLFLYGVPVDFIKECLELGGVRYGLLSHRPDFGRFKVISFKVSEEKSKTTRESIKPKK